MVRLACILTSLLWLMPRSVQEDLTIEQELAALIAKTNALESFHAIYDLKSANEDGDIEMSIELVYRAPDLGRMHFTGPEGEFDNWILGERAYFHHDESWKSAALPEPLPFSYVLDDLFPADEKPLEAGVVVMLALSRKSPEKGGFQLSFAAMQKGRTYVLGWLQSMQAWSGVTAEDSSLRWEDDGLRCLVSRETGLLEEVEITSPKEHMILRLREGHVDTPLDPELVTLPSAAAAAPILGGHPKAASRGHLKSGQS